MNSASNSAWRRWFGVAVLAATSGAAGWALGQRGHDDGRDPAPAAMGDARPVTTVLRPSTARGAGAAMPPFVDETISVHVDCAADDGTVVVTDSSCESADEDSGVVDVERLERTLTEGTESERHAALTQALEAGIDLPPELLRQTYANDPYESVRLLTFTTYVDSMSDDRAEVRAALQSAVYHGDTAVRNEAQRRLGELDQYERMLAEAAAQGLP